MNQEYTEIIFLLDRSGSMGGLESDTIGGYNGFVQKQLKEPGTTFISTILFDDNYEVLNEKAEASDICLTEKEYFVRGSTALLDAVGKSIIMTSKRFDLISSKELPDHVLFVITTDGLENASVEFTKERIKEMIEHQTKQHNWEFIFMGANIDSFKEAGTLGIRNDRTRNFNAEPVGVEKMYEDLHNMVMEAKLGRRNKNSGN